MNIQSMWEDWPDAKQFSGVFSISDAQGMFFERCCGLRNRSEGLPNNRDTAFGIASGTKLFTGLAACKLIDAGQLSLQDRLWDVVPHDLGRIDRRVTVRQLLTHTSGVGDYIDEEAPDTDKQMRALYRQYPVYLWERLDYYLPMITPLPPKFEPGTRFGYSNAGFVLLGLLIEAAGGLPYQQYVADTLLDPLGLSRTGFYRMDSLPANTAYGYTEECGAMRANIFSLPILGGSDGGLYTCAGDLDKLWRGLFSGQILSESMRRSFLEPQVQRDGSKSYGLGVYRYDGKEGPAYYAVGGDYGVDFFTAYFPSRKITASALGNTEINTYPLLDALLKALG